ncbi:MFS transporter [Sphingomonas endolithica]|uniref:MFS transporter n=1 Tax=Sphingomonas endolithica TaxID=2972485 RepID=UPI0021AF5672|nr:MFS transporter [Sphingomonas sp. ZFBP2030]
MHVANASVGLIGVQIVWGLINVSASRIFQTLGASITDLPILWIAAPVTGLVVQPIVGWLSDRTRSRFGRRRPYLAVGALMAAAAMVAMASAASLSAAITAFWLLTISANIAMQPLRALLADILPAEMRAAGYTVQVIFIGVGAVFASCLPWLIAEAIAPDHLPVVGLPVNIRLAFWIGAIGLLVSVGWTIARTHEPAATCSLPRSQADRPSAARSYRAAAAWLIAGGVTALIARLSGLRQEIYLIAAILAGYGVLQGLLVRRCRQGRPISGLIEIVDDIAVMPPAMRRLAIVQFFTWFGLFAMWVYAVPAVAMHYFGTSDPASSGYATSAKWVGILFASHDAVATAAALLLPRLSILFGVNRCYAASLALGAAGMIGMVAMPSPDWLWIPAIGIGSAWASILSAPYAIVANAVPQEKTGVYMGIHNIFLVLPQLVAASILGFVVQQLLAGDASLMMPMAAAAFLLAALTLGWKKNASE